jgi:prefoldin subunit 5
VEKDFPEALEYLERTTQELSDAIQKTISAMQEIQGYVEELDAAIQQEYAARRPQGNQ